MPPDSLLDRILWAQLARVLHPSPPEWREDLPSAKRIREVLAATELHPEESTLLDHWNSNRQSSRVLFDRLLQARVNRAVREGMGVEARALGLSEPPPAPKVLIARGDGPGDSVGASAPSPKKTVVEFLEASGEDIAELAPGAKLDQLVDLLVLANQDAAESLRTTLAPEATFSRPEESPQIDLLLAGPTPSIQVFDIERELARLEEVLRNAIPPERRPGKSGGTWSFGQDLTGERLGGKYLIRALKGKGAFKTVYEAEDEMLGARVAVAVLNPKGSRSPRALADFQDEAKKLTTLDHENIVRWITFDRSADGLHYFVMEYLDGEELEKTLRRQTKLAPKQVAQILLQVLGALRQAHAKGRHGSLLHLDLKPENVFLLPPIAPGDPQRVKVIDFGIGQHVGAEIRAADRPELRTLFDLPAEDLGKSIGSVALLEEDDIEEALSASGKDRVRVQRARGGTLLYASPEQCKHLAGHKDIEALDGRSDLYSLGVMAFRMLTGQFPFARNTTAFEAIQNHLEAPPRKVGSLGIKVPRKLAAFVDRCLLKERDKRWKDANEAFEALESIVNPRLSPVKVAVPATLALGLGLGALYFMRPPLEHALTLVDPSIESLSEQVVSELFLGPKSSSRVLRLDSDQAWNAEESPEVRLIDATSGASLPGWSVRWADEAHGIEITCQDGARSEAARLQLRPDRRNLWRSERITLNHLGPWRIERILVDGEKSGRPLDPRHRTFTLEVGGDSEGRRALTSIEVWQGEERLADAEVSEPIAHDSLALYTGPALDGAYRGDPYTAEWLIVARDRAGQEETTTHTLELAGAPQDFGPATGFVARDEPGTLLQAKGEAVVFPEDSLSIQVLAPAHVEIFLEGMDIGGEPPLFQLDIEELDSPTLVPLKDLGLARANEFAGLLVLRLDDAAWVERIEPLPRIKHLRFYYTPAAAEVEVRLSDLESELREGDSVVNPVHTGLESELVVRVPRGAVGSNLWLEASCSGPGLSQEDPRVLSPEAGGFRLPLAFPAEGPYEVRVQRFVLARGGERGPQIQPEYVYRLDVDRTAPRFALTVQGATNAGPTPLFREGSSQTIEVRMEEKAQLVELGWSLTLPNATTAQGTLDPGRIDSEGRLVLPSLLAHQEAEGVYEIELTAIDLAGNLHRQSQRWQRASEGPQIELQNPIASSVDDRWALGTGRAWNIRVHATDPNGVERVTARVTYLGTPGPELELAPTTRGLWELEASRRPSAYPWWTGKELVLEITATDGAGLQSSKVESGFVPELRREGLLIIARRDAPDSVEPPAVMVEVPAEGDYVFGGRKDEGPRAWHAEIPSGALRPYYLDAREVTRGEYLEFVRHEEGYSSPRWWSDGPPSADRAKQLARELGASPRSPATGLSWAEASAYAAWVGKRLPTLLEWEFAVRGNEYLEAPWQQISSLTPSGWPANLCTGPREWTSTPARLAKDDLDPGSQFRRHWKRLLAPDSPPAAGAGSPPPSNSHWIVGSAQGESPTWRAKRLGSNASLDPGVGFRCVLSQEIAHSLLDRGEYEVVE